MKHAMKMFVCILLTMAMLFGLCSCGKDTGGLGKLEIGSTSETEETLAPLGGNETQETEPTSEATSEASSETTTEPTSESDSGNQFIVDEYSCDYFDCYIPQGWDVHYQVVDAGSGLMRIYVFVQDPTDENNIIFFVSAMEPWFITISEKNAVAAILGSAYDWSPVVDELSAEGLLKEWAATYTLMDATGFTDGVKYFKNYSIVSVLNSEIFDGASEQETKSEVIAEVSIPGASQTYGILYANDFMQAKFPYAANARYYISYQNRGFVLSADRFSAEAEGMAYCVSSFDFAKFNSTYGSSNGITVDGSAVVNPEITLPDMGAFFQ